VNDAVGREWILSSVNPTDYRLDMRKEAAIKLSQDTLTQSMNTIEEEGERLGSCRGKRSASRQAAQVSRILVQLLASTIRACRAILQTAAMLELSEVKDGPFKSQEEARSKHGGSAIEHKDRPRFSDRPKGKVRYGGCSPARRWSCWPRLARRTSAGRDAGPLGDRLVLTGCGAPLRTFHQGNVGNRLAIVLDNVVLSAPTIEMRSRPGPDHGRWGSAGGG
jgi:preprotein translocase subunit SecD